jgi:hypothetical protein
MLLPIADCQFPICANQDFANSSGTPARQNRIDQSTAIGNWQLAIGNHMNWQ